MIKWLTVCLLMLVGCQNNAPKEQRIVRNGMVYHQAYNDDSICIASVCLEDDKIISAMIDELTYLSKEEYKGLIEPEDENSKKIIASKIDNNEAYSQVMQANGATKTINENYDAICEYVIGKSATDLQSEIEMKTDEEVVDLVAGCTLKSTKGYIQAIINACNQAN